MKKFQKVRAPSETDAFDFRSTKSEQVSHTNYSDLSVDKTRIRTDADEKIRMRNCGCWIKRKLEYVDGG